MAAGGPGGQHRNKTESAVRLTHPPTGVTVTATERRSQHENREVALERLRERIAALPYVPKVRRATRPTRGSQERRLAGKKRDARVRSATRGSRPTAAAARADAALDYSSSAARTASPTLVE